MVWVADSAGNTRTELKPLKTIQFNPPCGPIRLDSEHNRPIAILSPKFRASDLEHWNQQWQNQKKFYQKKIIKEHKDQNLVNIETSS